MPCQMKNAKTRGFSFTEIMLAAMVLGLLVIYVFTLISESNRGTASAYHQYLAEQIAREPLEVFRFLGSRKVRDNLGNGIADYRFNEWQKIETVSSVTGIERPEDAAAFERKITVTPLSRDDIEAILVQVTVRPARGGVGLGVGLEQLNRSAIIVSQP
jgi:Tfp pilus assembly protein PilV